jgi:hypothetical protein
LNVDKVPPTQQREKKKRTERTDVVNNTTRIGESLDLIYQGLQRRQRTTETILGIIKTQHRTLILELNTKSQDGTLSVDEIRRLFEQGFRDIEKNVRELVTTLVDDTWAQQCRVISVKEGIRDGGAVENLPRVLG